VKKRLPFAAVGLSVFVVTAVALWSVDFVALSPIRRGGTAVDDLRSQLANLHARRQQVEADLNLLRDASRQLSGFDFFHEPASPAGTASAVQEEVRRLVAEIGGVLLSSQATTEGLNEGATRIRISVRARIDEDGLLELLQQIDEARPRIIVSGLELQPTAANDSMPPIELAGVLVAFHYDAR
jgi:hypothetical protein